MSNDLEPVEEEITQEELELEAQKQAEEERDTYYQLNADNNVAIKNRDAIIKDLKNQGLSDEAAEDLFEETMIKYFAQHVDVKFAQSEDNLIGVLRKIKDLVDQQIHEQGLLADETYHQIRSLYNRVFKD